MALSEKERMMLYLLLAVIGILVLAWFIRDNSSQQVPSGSGGYNIPNLSNLPQLSDAQKRAIRSMGAKQLLSLKKRLCPTCKNTKGECNCPPSRPTMEDAQNICAGMDPTQGVPLTPECLNAIYNVYGCNDRYPDTSVPLYDYDVNQTFAGAASDAYAWSTMTDDDHRNGCYAPGKSPNFQPSMY